MGKSTLAGALVREARRRGRTVAVLTLYAPEPDVFDVDMRALLEQVTENVSFALDGYDAARRLEQVATQRTELLRRLVTAQEGDDLRFVDWNLYARLDRLFLKLFLEEEDLHVFFLVDASPSMNFGDPTKFVGPIYDQATADRLAAEDEPLAEQAEATAPAAEEEQKERRPRRRRGGRKGAAGEGTEAPMHLRAGHLLEHPLVLGAVSIVALASAVSRVDTRPTQCDLASSVKCSTAGGAAKNGLTPRARGFLPAPRGGGPGILARLLRPLRSAPQLALYAQGFLLMGGFVALFNYVGFRLAAAPFNLSATLIGLPLSFLMFERTAAARMFVRERLTPYFRSGSALEVGRAG